MALRSGWPGEEGSSLFSGFPVLSLKGSAQQGPKAVKEDISGM